VRQTTARKLQNLGRLLPLLISMGAIATYGVWNYAPHWVQQVDSNVISSYLGTSRERYL
jgi:hypothetical protein